MEANTTVFRMATEDDIPSMSRIRLAVLENRLTDPSRITMDMYRDYLHRLGRGWVCEIDGAVVGFAYADTEKSSIWALFVDPASTGRGIGKGLLALAVECLFSLGYAEVQLSTGVGTRADSFYAMQGWTRGPVKSDGEVMFSLSANCMMVQ